MKNNTTEFRSPYKKEFIPGTEAFFLGPEEGDIQTVTIIEDKDRDKDWTSPHFIRVTYTDEAGQLQRASINSTWLFPTQEEAQSVLDAMKDKFRAEIQSQTLNAEALMQALFDFYRTYHDSPIEQEQIEVMQHKIYDYFQIRVR